MVLKFWENISTTSTETFTVVLIRPDCVYDGTKYFSNVLWDDKISANQSVSISKEKLKENWWKNLSKIMLIIYKIRLA